jgi:hypothetical protein
MQSDNQMPMSMVRRESERESERLENAAGRAFRIYLAARSEGRSANEIATLKAAYEVASSRCRSVRLATHGGAFRTGFAA